MTDEARLLFHQLADLAHNERERFFAERQIAPEIRAELESLLAFDSVDDRPLTNCVSAAAQDVLSLTHNRAPDRCGPYRIVRQLGSGGMGAVYLAERSDGEIQQQVAVKLLGATPNRSAWRGRFLKERQILASLHHPSIVHVIDAGHTADGQPYLAMEYVEGVPIDAYATGLSVRDCLALFLRVCDGISHAHRHLIIHRDLKPSNILVDASGQPKLLDFGIAKLMDDTGDATQTVERLLTPNYASPEQLAGATQTTATDIYSLGAVLYKLLTGHSPQESKQQPPTRLNPSIPADLDYIISKALRSEPEERYASVEAFAGDIQAFLESRPVEARSGNTWYRARKFVRRYWIPVGAAALVIASLSGGLYVANRERAVAQRRFGQVRQLAGEFLALDGTIQNLPGATAARQQIVARSLAYLEALGAEARTDRDLALEIGKAYLQVARVQGVPSGSNLGDFAGADQTLGKAEAIVDAVLHGNPKNRLALRTSAEIAHDRMILATGTTQQQVLTQIGKATTRLEALLALGNTSTEESMAAGRILSNVGRSYFHLGLYDATIRYARQAMETLRPIQSGQALRGKTSHTLAMALQSTGDPEGALQAIRQARTLVESAEYPGEVQRRLALAQVLAIEGDILGGEGWINLNRPGEAIQSFQEAFEIWDQLAAKDANDSQSRFMAAANGMALAAILSHRNPERALAIYDRCLVRLRETRLSMNRSDNEAGCLAESCGALLRLHRLAEAKQRIDAAFALIHEWDWDRASHVMREETESTLRAQAAYQEQTGQPERAAGTYQQLLDGLQGSQPNPETDLVQANKLSRTYASVAALFRRTGEAAKAETIESRRQELWRHWDSKLPNNAFIQRQLAAASVR